jgi:hypothetical protein
MILLGILCVFRLQAGVKAALITFLVCSHPGSLVPVNSGSTPSIGIGGVFFSSFCLAAAHGAVFALL